jgi:thioredoxin-like negative regulator of GroEL
MNKPKQAKHDVRYLPDAEVAPLLAATAGPVIMVISTDWCAPCRLLKPVVHKLSLEFAVPVFFVDGDIATETKSRYGVNGFPELLVCQDGRLVGRYGGFSNAEELRKVLAGFLGRSVDGSSSVAELAFHEAYERADTRISEIMTPASDALDPYIVAVAPEMKTVMASINDDLAAGRIDKTEAAARRKAERDRIQAPFQDKIDVLVKAQAEALEAYDVIMDDALAQFARAHSAGAATPEEIGSDSMPGLVETKTDAGFRRQSCSIEDHRAGIDCG